MLWTYTAVNGLAREVFGAEAGPRHEVLARLKERGLIVVSLDPDPVAALKLFTPGATIGPRRLASFFKDFSNMFGAGLALNHILATFQESVLDAPLAAVCRRISVDLSAGKSLAQAMGMAGVFPPIALHAVRAGEKAGHMPLVMDLLAAHFELIAGLRARCFGALVYPVCVLCFLFAAFIYVSQAVVPQLEPLLPAAALQEPLTRAMLALSGVARSAWVPLSLAIGLIAGGLVFFWHRSPESRETWLSRVPWFGLARRDLQISVCFFDLYILLKSGIPLDTALGEVAECGDGLTGRKIALARQYLSAGHTFSAALAETGHFPRQVVETIRLGEEIGKYDDPCERVFKLYYRAFEMRVNVLVGAVQPLMLGFCALFIAVMALAFLKPIYANLTQIGMIKP